MENNNETNIGKDLALRRICKGLRQWQVARRVGICATVLSDYETGKRQPSPETVSRIEAAILELTNEL